jgi:transposase
MERMTKIIKVPVVIDEPDDDLRKIKYNALYRAMLEARYLTNLGIRYAIAYRLKEISDNLLKKSGKKVPIDTRIYRNVIKERKILESGIVATLSRNYAAKLVKTHDKDAWVGRKSLPTIKSLFVPFRHIGTKINQIVYSGSPQIRIAPQGFAERWLSNELIEELSGTPDYNFTSVKRKLILKSCFSWKDKRAVEVSKKIISNEYTLKDSEIHVRASGLIVFLAYNFKIVQRSLDPEKICGIKLGSAVPAICAVNFGPQRKYIGSSEDVWAARSKFRAQRRRHQKRIGPYSKSKKWSRSTKEVYWIQSYYHAITRQVIKFCQKHGCSAIHVEDPKHDLDRQKNMEYKKLLWIPSKFNELLYYKAQEQGISFVKVNSQNTSYRCSECGFISPENRRSQAEFICQQCGDAKKPVNADYNAARNLALATEDVILLGYISP